MLCFMRSKTTATAGGSSKRSASAPAKYQTHLKEPSGFRKQELGGLVDDSYGMVSFLR